MAPLAFRAAVVIVALVVVLGFYTFHQADNDVEVITTDEEYPSANVKARLGFDDIYVVTAGFHDWRSQGLKAAANRTNLAITFLQQPQWTIKQKADFHKGDKYSTWTIPGSTGCWLGHLHALKHFLSTNQQTALIMEDDADWDVDIQTQVLRAQQGLRLLTHSPTTEPWGTLWDIIYLGHCGDKLKPRNHVYHDSGVPDIKTDYTGFHYGSLDILPPKSRAIHRSTRPVCTFGYAVTRRGAEKIINLSHDAKAIDTRIGRACENHENNMRCWTINPEIIHHHVPAGDAPSEIQTKQDISVQAWTANILHSARCNANRSDDDLISCSKPEVPLSS